MKTKILQFALSGCILVAVVTFNILCAKSAPKQVFPLELVAACADSSGVFVPVYTDLINVSTVAGGSAAHFIRVCNEVTVTGHLDMFGAPLSIGGPSFITMSLPIPISGTTTPEPGLLNVFQSGVRYPITGQVLTNTTGTITLRWYPTAAAASSITYIYVYTIK